MNNPQDIAILEKLTDVLANLHIPYCIGGSLASSAYGKVRFTQDADITVEPFGQIAEKFYENLKNEFYITKEAMTNALQNRNSFNVIHFVTAFKIDIFIRKENDFQKQMLLHTRKLKLGTGDKLLCFVSPEDIILLKLDWFKQSDSTSQRQWTDVIGVLQGQANTIDFEYLKIWAKKLGFMELLTQAISESKT